MLCHVYYYSEIFLQANKNEPLESWPRNVILQCKFNIAAITCLIRLKVSKRVASRGCSVSLRYDDIIARTTDLVNNKKTNKNDHLMIMLSPIQVSMFVHFISYCSFTLMSIASHTTSF